MEKNYSIKCDVTRCKHNNDGCNCALSQIKVTCGCEGENCTCCGDFCDKENC